MVEGVIVKPDGGRAVVVAFAPKGIAANAVENLPDLSIVDLLVHQEWAPIPKLLEGGSAFRFTA